MGKRGVRSQKGQAESEWGEPKTGRITLALTETGKKLTKARADQMGFSLSEILERWGRGVSVDSDANTEATVSVKTIIKTLPRLSRSQLVRVVWAALTLLIGKPPEPDPDLLTIQEELCTSNPEVLGKSSGVPPERIVEIQKGGDIYCDELIKLARVFKMKPSELKEHLPNRVTNGCNT